VSATALRARITSNHGSPEHSVAIRLAVALTVEVAVIAVVAQGAADASTGIAAVLLVPAGYAFSYVRRTRPSVVTKLALAAGLIVALAMFLRSVHGATSFDDARQPLASLFLWVQALHAFDVPRRRDLGFSVVSSVILIAEAGALSFGTGFLVFLVPWLVLAGAYSFLTTGPRPDEVARVVEVRRISPGRSTRGAIGRTVATWLAVAGLVVGVVFIAMPRLPGATVALPPFRSDGATPVDGFKGQVVNPGLDVGGDGVAEFSDLAYPGFSPTVDLRSRGRLSDEVVLRVRSPQASLWRGLVYDTFDGTRWTASDDRHVSIGRGFDDSFGVPPSIEGVAPWIEHRRVLSTVYVQRPLPNVVFAPAQASQIFFPTSTLTSDVYGSVRSPILLDPGVVYSVISEVPVAPPELLRNLDTVPITDALRERLRGFLELPSDLPARDVELARRITGNESTTYDKADAVQTWLHEHTRYNLDVPPEPPGVDSVDEFLFERREGFCEHIASAMAILLRASGVPTRLVTGFAPGQRNPFTGYWDIRASDAHAWVEVFYPGAGWIAYDPTFGVPPADPGLSAAFIAPQVLKAIGHFVGALVPEPVRRAVVSVGHALARLVSAWPMFVALALAAALVVVVGRRRRVRRRAGPRPAGVAKAFALLEDAAFARGHPREPHQTPQEFLRMLGSFLPEDARADAEIVVRTFEIETFSPRHRGDAAQEALAAAERVLASR
jgi:protein-glutamine gamma-glutamyltransferase